MAKSNKQQELEANLFAMAILMPENLLRQELAKVTSKATYEETISILANRFEVSKERMAARLTQLEIMI